MKLTKGELTLNSFHKGSFTYGCQYSPTTRRALRKLDHAQFYLRRQYFHIPDQKLAAADYIDSANILNDARNAVYVQWNAGRCRVQDDASIAVSNAVDDWDSTHEVQHLDGIVRN